MEQDLAEFAVQILCDDSIGCDKIDDYMPQK